MWNNVLTESKHELTGANEMTKLQQALNSINFDENNKVGGEYGLHDGFFNLLVVIDDVDYYVQGCADNDLFDVDDCGHNDGVCGDVNEALAIKLSEDRDNDLSEGYELVRFVLETAYDNYI